jgi:hypothetical protein
MVKRFVDRLGRWPVVAGWPASDDVYGPPPAASQPVGYDAAPGRCEMRFMKLHAEGRFEEMWDMLADDAQRAWGGLQHFIREMPRLDEWLEILEMDVASVTMLENWTDHVHGRSYENVARLVMRYRVRQQWKEWTFDRQVHLVAVDDGWRTLCYPMRAGAAAGR